MSEAAVFSGFTKETVRFYAELRKNNNKPWFEEHRQTYERLRAEWLALVGQVIDGVAEFDPSVADVVSPKDATFRINRDVRFSSDKRPYKTTFSAAICPQGRGSGMPAYYFAISEVGVLLIAGGVYMPPPPILGQIRQYIADHPEQLAAVLADASFSAVYGAIEGERLKRPPQGYDERTPGIEFIKLKSFTAGIKPEDWLVHADSLVDDLSAAFRALFPLIHWLRQALAGRNYPGRP